VANAAGISNFPDVDDVSNEAGEERLRRKRDISASFASSALSARNPFSSLRVSASSRESEIALRLGLRQVDGFPEHAAAQLVAARQAGAPFRDVAELRERAKLIPSHVEKLAAADCFGSLALPRRQALWDARSLVSAPALPLFAYADTREEGAERARTRLPHMPLSEEVVADYQTTRLSLKAHPLSFLRASLTGRGFIPCAQLRSRKQRSAVQVAGVVLIRQRPGSAKGVCFITLEDESGIANLVVWPDVMERFRAVVMGARLIEVRGRVEYEDDVIHVIASHLADATGDLHALSDDLVAPQMDHADHLGRQTHHAHPRNVRVIPKSRDFH
jgi:error-prone DNA polymerase